jgi:hypothetical protein
VISLASWFQTSEDSFLEKRVIESHQYSIFTAAIMTKVTFLVKEIWEESSKYPQQLF